jgi:hypothetical protein
VSHYTYPHERGIRRFVAIEESTIRGYIDAKTLQSAQGVARMRGYPEGLTIVPIEIVLRGIQTH